MSSTPADSRESSKSSAFTRRITDARERHIEKVVAAAAEFPTGQFRVDINEFIRRYYADVSAEDMRDRKPVALAGMALSHLAFGQQRKPGETLVRTFAPDPQKDG